MSKILESLDLLIEAIGDIVKSPIQEKQAMDLLEAHCKKNMTQGELLWRGNRMLTEDYYFFSAEKKKKPGFFDKIINFLSKYPRRDESIICTTNKLSALSWGGGHLYQVIPYDNSGPYGVAQMGYFWQEMASSEDFWKQIGAEEIKNSFSATFDTKTTVDKLISSFLVKGDLAKAKTVAIMALNYDGKTPAEAKKIVDQYSDISSFKDWVKKKLFSVNFFEVMGALLSKNCNLTLVKNYPALKMYSDKEVWFNTPAVLIRIK